MTYVSVSIGLIAGNCIYAAINGGWDAAIDRSWFQVGAIFALWLTMLVRDARRNP